ncbi:MAG: hypothetical protein ACI9LM_005391 [Alteromonadaceae bacterium]|jgi:hypothetical protein
MTQLKQNSKCITRSCLASLTILLASSLTIPAYADTTDMAEINSICESQSISIANELKSQSEQDLTMQDIDFMRLGAVSACKETYQKLLGYNTDKSVAENEVGKQSIFSDLFNREKRKDVNPMQKLHRTGGK